VSLESAQLASLRAFYRVLAGGHPASKVVEIGGDVQACVVPETPGASIANGVLYSDAVALREALPELKWLYGELPWLVWVRPHDQVASLACAVAGLHRDGQPALMGAPLEAIAAPRGGVEVADGDWSEIAVLNGLPPHILAVPPAPQARILAVRDGGQAVSVALFVDHEANLGVYFVATAPEARRQGLASELLRVGCAEARRRGLETTTLESSAMGEPVYAALGFRRLGELETWEHRSEPKVQQVV
jgi:ribosomal protein S18 acetylase RimI-like enzyme